MFRESNRSAPPLILRRFSILPIARIAVCAGVAFLSSVCPFPFSSFPLVFAASSALPIDSLPCLFGTLVGLAGGFCFAFLRKTPFSLLRLLFVGIALAVRGVLFLTAKKKGRDSSPSESFAPRKRKNRPAWVVPWLWRDRETDAEAEFWRVLLGSPHHGRTESLFSDALLCTFCLVSVGLYRLIVSDFALYDLFALLLALPIGLIFFYAAAGILTSADNERTSPLFLLCCLVLSFAAVYSSAQTDIRLIGVPLSLFLALLLVFFAVDWRGGIGGILFAAAAGAACGKDFFLGILAAALCFTVLRPFFRRPALTVSSCLCLAVTVWRGGLTVLPDILPSLFAAALLYSFCSGLLFPSHKPDPPSRTSVPTAEPQPDFLSFSRLFAAWDELRELKTRLCALLHASAELDFPEGKTADFCREILRTAENDCRPNPKEEEQMRTLLTARKQPFSALAVIGGRRKKIRIQGISFSSFSPFSEPIRLEAEKICRCHFHAPIFESAESDAVIFTTAPRLSVRFAERHLASGEEISGDTAVFFRDNRDFAYLLLADGMGSGEKAAQISSLCAAYAEKLIGNGARMEATLRLLNDILSRSGEECSCALDLVRVDLLRPGAALVKSGAAPTFLWRSHKLRRLEAVSAPIGILPTLNSKMLSLALMPGDVMIVTSDGAVPNGDAGALPDFLFSLLEKEKDPNRIAEKTVAFCSRQTPHDDITVAVLLMEKTA